MDPFAGLGSTAIACARLGINFIGADIDEAYLTEAVMRTRVAVIDQAMRQAGNSKGRVAPIEPSRTGRNGAEARDGKPERVGYCFVGLVGAGGGFSEVFFAGTRRWCRPDGPSLRAA